MREREKGEEPNDAQTTDRYRENIRTMGSRKSMRMGRLRASTKCSRKETVSRSFSRAVLYRGSPVLVRRAVEGDS
jgi:hypothetical protein